LATKLFLIIYIDVKVIEVTWSFVFSASCYGNGLLVSFWFLIDPLAFWFIIVESSHYFLEDVKPLFQNGLLAMVVIEGQNVFEY
jgi:hypothetical protein